jgi:hypothetical protein
MAERTFLAAADAARTSLAAFYIKSAQAGEPRLPRALSQLGPDALPADPWTGVADWGALRNADGGIVGVYSRSGHPIRDFGRLAGLAQLRSDMPAAQVAVLGVSAWAFRWEPPVLTHQRSAMDLTALDALAGRWPQAGSRPLAASILASEPMRLTDRLILSEDALRRPQAPVVAAPMATRSEHIHVASIDPTAWSVYVPIAPISETNAPGEPSGESSALGQVVMGSPTAQSTVAMGDDGSTNEVIPLSEDPRTRRCQVAFGAQHPEDVCRIAKQESATDAGVAYDACVRDLEIRVAECANQR